MLSSLGKTSEVIEMIEIMERLDINESYIYEFSAPKYSHNVIEITGERFHIEMQSPTGGLQISEREFFNNLDIDWVHLEYGNTRLKVTNTGDTYLEIEASFEIAK